MMNAYDLAKSICKVLFDAGYTAYFAGGWVRDLLLNKASNEIDIATSAPPQVIQSLFPKTIPVGIAFGVIIVVIKGINFEVTTFRKDHPYLDGRHPDGIDFSTPEKDALRRDFTINGIFFDPLSEILYDYVGGQEDLKNQVIRAIGDPNLRFAEDRLRMIRAVRFATRFNFSIEKETEKAIKEHANTLFPSVSMERIWQEFNKMKPMRASIEMLHRLGLLSVIFPLLENVSLEEIEKRCASFDYFPPECPTIIFLMELFPNESLNEKIALCRYLKTTSKDIKLVEFFSHAKKLFEEDVEWAHFYAHPFHELFLQITASKILPPERLHFVREHEHRKKRLKKHIERIEKRHPLVNAAFLQKLGVAPGKYMGELLKEAERIAVNEDLHHPEEVVEILKNHGFEIPDKQ